MNFLFTHKKLLLLIPVGLILGVIFFFGLQPSPTTSPAPTPNLSAFPKTPATTPIQVDYPYKDPSGKFVISYLPDSDDYTITLLSSPFDVVRTQAEQAFLSQLKLTKAQACQKNVRIATPRFANPDQSGQDFPLSFCSSSSP